MLQFGVSFSPLQLRDQTASSRRCIDESGSLPAAAKTLKALPRRTAIPRRCLSHMVSRGSPVASRSLRPRSLTIFRVEGPKTQVVSRATGSNRYLSSRALYLTLFALSAAAAADDGSMAERMTLLGAKESTQVASQTRLRPLE